MWYYRGMIKCICGKCNKTIEFDRKLIKWKRHKNIKEKWVKCQCGNRFVVETKWI